MITIEHLRKEYPNVTPIKDVSCHIDRGEVISVIGPSGTGKSTFLRCINHLETPTSGKIIVNGIDITDPATDICAVRRNMGMVFQSFNLFAHLMIIENIMLGPTDLLGTPRQQAFDEGMELLRSVGLAEKAFAYPDELSGGQKQRAAIARTLAMKPDIILFDEPTSALDPTMVGEVLFVIRALARQGLTMIIVTHEMQFARDVSSRIFYMDEGVIYEQGTPDQIFGSPQRDRTRIFIKRLKTFERVIENKGFDFIRINSDISEFTSKHMLSARTGAALEHIFEEIAMTNIIPRLPEQFSLKFTIEVAESGASITAGFSWKGERFDPIVEGDELAAMIIKKLTREISFDFSDGQNKLLLSLDKV